MKLKEIEQIFGAATGQKTSTGSTGERYMDQNGAWHSLKGNKRSITRYEGKAGSIRRSAKGRTRRMPDGKRYFNGIMDNELTMVAYKVK